MDNPQKLTHISLCAGYGGIDIGLQRALGAVRTVCYVEIGLFPIRNLVAKIEAGLLDNCPVFSDLKQFPWEVFGGRVDILSGGFPCQPFSSAGQRAGDQDPRHLWPYITDGIRRLGRPAIVFFENVEGILSSKLAGTHWSDPEGTPVLLHIHREMERLGYHATSGLFSASEVGAPHQRKRVFILGVRADLRAEGRASVNAMLAERARADQQLVDSGVSLRTAWPAARGTEQYAWEPPRVSGPVKLAHANSERLEGSDQLSEPAAGLCEEVDEADDTLWLFEQEDVDADEWTDDAVVHTDSIRCAAELPVSGINPAEESEQSAGVDALPACADGADGCDSSAQPEMGRSADGLADWLGHAELYESCDNRTDELRLLGNGVVPDTAALAFRVLWERIGNI